LNQNSTVASFLEQIASQYQELSRQLKRIATYIEAHQHEMALLRIQDVATACEVQPSAVVRFAQRFGFKGYSDLQSVFRESMLAQAPSSHHYRRRIQEAIQHGSPDSSEVLARRFIRASREGLDALDSALDAQAFDAAVALLAASRNIYVIGMGRSLSVASYLAYALQNLGRPAHFLSGVGGDPRQAMRAIGPDDVLFAISFAPYATETQASMQLARDSGARILLLTDSVLASICALSDVQLFAQEQTAFEFKTLTSTICLAQALFIALAHTLERQSNLDSYSPGR